MTMSNHEKLRINNQIEYNCTDVYNISGVFEISVITSDYTALMNSLSEIKTLEVINTNENTRYITKDYSTYSNIQIQNGFYTDIDGVPQITYRIRFKKTSLEDKLNQLSKIIDPEANEDSMSLDQFKSHRINSSKTALQEYLEKHPLVSSCHGNKKGLYTITKEKQDLLMANYMSYQIEKKVNPNAHLTWNETGKECEEWTEQEVIQLSLEIKQFVYPRVSLQQKYETEIIQCTTKNEVKEIIFDYA